MSLIALVKVTKNYGQEAIYPANDVSTNITKLTGKKTLSRWDIEQIKSLGIKIQVAQEVL